MIHTHTIMTTAAADDDDDDDTDVLVYSHITLAA